MPFPSYGAWLAFPDVTWECWGIGGRTEGDCLATPRSRPPKRTPVALYTGRPSLTGHTDPVIYTITVYT